MLKVFFFTLDWYLESRWKREKKKGVLSYRTRALVWLWSKGVHAALWVSPTAWANHWTREASRG